MIPIRAMVLVITGATGEGADTRLDVLPSMSRRGSLSAERDSSLENRGEGEGRLTLGAEVSGEPKAWQDKSLGWRPRFQRVKKEGRAKGLIYVAWGGEGSNGACIRLSALGTRNDRES